MQMIHSAVCSQRVEGQAEEGVVSLMRKLERQLQRRHVHLLTQLGQHAWHQQHMAVLYGADVDEDQIRRPCKEASAQPTFFEIH